ncbi:cysteine methyltransferase [Pedobacter yulinensis]|uniref:Cysteine methyltransferase n=1 Tax=Pedobacter yulinensis TaxID=2126353 RepID=A0A2T3HH74_9SPHI|nr:methylated-DNA--[protein]-cysteine S-methyltransferase [Pedobacter yulinensis]PST81753.1 cysteine methyltransferase [Pedobacter yulinensis]
MINTYASLIETPIGPLHIFATETHVCRASFEPHNLDGFVSNSLSELAAKEFNAYFDGTLRSFSFPVDQPGTGFQKEVWKQLLAIPYAQTLSYASFAAERPLAIRAMAAANGKNNVIIAVPCHRVIGSDGKLVGFAAGLWRKKWLLQHERDTAQTGQAALKF